VGDAVALDHHVRAVGASSPPWCRVGIRCWSRRLRLADRRERPGLIVNTIARAFGAYLGNVLYDTAKAATARLAFGFAHDLPARPVRPPGR
jgi:hypothetical protein